MAKFTRRLADAPVFITNVGGVLTAALEILHDLDRDRMERTDLAALDRAIAMLSITQDACDHIVDEIESGAEYRYPVTSGAVVHQ